MLHDVLVSCASVHRRADLCQAASTTIVATLGMQCKQNAIPSARCRPTGVYLINPSFAQAHVLPACPCTPYPIQSFYKYHSSLLCEKCSNTQKARVNTTRCTAVPQHASPPQDLSVPSLSQLAALAGEEMELTYTGPNALGYRGLLLKEPVLRQTVVSVPLHNALVISDAPLESISVFGDQCQQAWQQQHGELPGALLEFLTGEERWDVRLIAWLLWLHNHHFNTRTARQGSREYWRTYLHHLPSEADQCTLANYEPAEAVELQITRMIEEAGCQREWVMHMHKVWLGADGVNRGSRAYGSGSGDIRSLQLARTIQDTLWASSMVRSRTFSDTVSGEGITMVVPWADLANHAPTDWNASWNLSSDKNSFELRSMRPLAAGEELTISYGDHKTNAELMRDYGFFIPGNPWDRIPLPGLDILTQDSTMISGQTEGQAGLPAAMPQSVLLARQGSTLNGASLWEALKLQGDWVNDSPELLHKIQPLAKSDQVAAARQICAALSLPLNDGHGGWGGACMHGGRKSGALNNNTQPSLPGRPGALSWLPWTQQAKESQAPPAPCKLVAAQVPSERENISHLKSHFHSLLAALPTTASTDEGLLARTDRSAPTTPRYSIAVQFRLDHKRLILTGSDILQQYDKYLAASVILPTARL